MKVGWIIVWICACNSPKSLPNHGFSAMNNVGKNGLKCS